MKRNSPIATGRVKACRNWVKVDMGAIQAVATKGGKLFCYRLVESLTLLLSEFQHREF